MTAIAERGPTAAEREHSPLVAELEHVRALLDAHRLGEPPPEREQWEPEGFEPAVDRLARLVGLTPFERQLLLLTAAVELDGDLAALVAALQDGADPRPTFGLALAALPGAHWDALAPGSPLRRWRLVEPLAGPTLASLPLRIDERVLHHLTGLDAPDERLAGTLRVAAVVPPLAPSQQRFAEELARTVAGAGSRVAVRLDGEDTDARARDRSGPRVRARTPRARRAGERAAGRRARPRRARKAGRPRGAALRRAADPGDGRRCGAGDRLAPRRARGAGHRAPRRLAVRTSGRVELHRTVELPSPTEQRALWTTALGEPVAQALAEPVEDIAQHFRLSATAVDAVARELAATATAGTDAATTLKRLCRERSRVRLEGLADRVEPAATWDDLVLPPAHAEMLREIVRHVRHRAQVYERWGFGARTARGLGVTALFAGESGTGKTLAAEVLAHELGLDLYRIDLAATVSKYIGETEKNLRRLFVAAEASGAVLLFDEADALFGKRGEVKDGHDRYANLEVAYLLQRMESYRGLAILTTNLRSNVDRAFLRRLRFVVQFPFPAAEERAEIWRRTFPPVARSRESRSTCSPGWRPREARSGRSPCRLRLRPPRTAPGSRRRTCSVPRVSSTRRPSGRSQTPRSGVCGDRGPDRDRDRRARRARALARGRAGRSQRARGEAGDPRRRGREQPPGAGRGVPAAAAGDGSGRLAAAVGDAVAGAVWGAVSGGGAT